MNLAFDPTPSLWARRIVVVVIILYAGLATAYSIAFPIFESWDEPHHYQYIRYLIEQRALPVQPADGTPTHYFQPPAYYLLAAALTAYLPADDYRPEFNAAFATEYWNRHNKNWMIHPRSIEGWPWRGTALNVHMIRFLSVGCGVGVLLLSHALFRRLRPEDPAGNWLAVGAMTLTAFHPTFLYLTGSINNMVLGTLVGVALTLLLADVALDGLTWQRTIHLGLLLGLASLIRWTLAPFLGVLVGAVVVSAATWRRPGEVVIRVSAMLLIMVAIGLWWYLRSLRLYGDPLGIALLRETWREGRTFGGPSFLSGVPRLLVSYWGSFGPWGSIRVPEWVSVLFAAFTLMGVVGVLHRWAVGQLGPDGRRAVFVLGSTAAGFYAFALIAGSQSVFGVQQRWLMPGHTAAMGLLALGWWHIVERLRMPTVCHAVWAGLPLALSVGSLFGLILPAYAPPRAVADLADLDFVTPYNVEVGGIARLVGVSVPEHVQPGSLTWVEVCWQVIRPPQASYWQFVHIVGLNNEVLAGIDSVPGLGNYPTLDWQPGTSHCTDWPLAIPGDALPGQYTVQTGLYNRTTMERLEAAFPDGERFNPPMIGALVVDAMPSDLPASATSADVGFGGIIRLRGWELSPPDPSPGDLLTLTLYWEATAPPPVSYTVFVHLIDPRGPGQPLVQADNIPRGGLYPTNTWIVGGLVPDVHTLDLPLDLPPGDYTLRIGLYDLASGQRLPGPTPDSSLALPLRLGDN